MFLVSNPLVGFKKTKSNRLLFQVFQCSCQLHKQKENITIKSSEKEKSENCILLFILLICCSFFYSKCSDEMNEILFREN